MTDSDLNSRVQKAGAVILSSRDRNVIALLYRGKQGDWSFPKGHVDSGEDATGAMVREIQEETGLAVKIVRALPDMTYVSSAGENVELKMFLVESQDDSLLRTEFGGDKIEWVALADVATKLSHDNLKVYFTSVLPLLS